MRTVSHHHSDSFLGLRHLSSQLPPPSSKQRRNRPQSVLEFRASDGKCYAGGLHELDDDAAADAKDELNTVKANHEATIYTPQQDSQDWKLTKIKPYCYPNLLSSLLENNTGSNSNNNNTKSRITNLQTIQQFLFDNVVKHFLPAQYPDSVANGYARFSLLSFSASVAGSAAMVLSTQTLLLAVGVVGQSASASGQAGIMAGAMNWVLKDGIGQLGGVIFASRMGEAKRLDSDPKRWRMLAALSLDGASFLEIISPLFWSSWVLPVACIANIGKNIGFLTAGASRAAIHQSLALHGNLADVTAKSASQSMAAGLLGTAVGIGLSTALHHDASNFIVGFCTLSVIHQSCNYISLKAVPLQRFNRHRLHLLLTEYIQSEKQTVLGPSQVARREHYFPLFVHPDPSYQWLFIGSSLQDAFGSVQDFESICELLQNEEYLLNVVDEKIHLIFLAPATGEDVVKGMHHAYVLKQHRSTGETRFGQGGFVSLKESYDEAAKHVPNFLETVTAYGWNIATDVTYVEGRQARRLRLQ